MASLNRPTVATYTIHEKMTVNTSDRMDHTFSGIMFPIQCKENLPLERVVITSIAVRGELGPMTVWVSNDPEEEAAKKTALAAAAATAAATSKRKRHNKKDTPQHCQTSHPSCSKRGTASHSTKPVTPAKPKTRIAANKHEWTQIYERTHDPSRHTYQELDISQNPIYLKPGQTRGIYIHSSLPNDEAIVYDNYHSTRASEIPQDDVICLKPGMAHVTPVAFGSRPIWGWGEAWRRDRTFVGRLEYGIVYKLWNPRHHLSFGENFQTLAMLLFACQRRFESPLCRLPDDCIFYILNMCKWDWVGDDSKRMKDGLLKRKKKLKLLLEQKTKEEQTLSHLKSNDDNDDDEKMQDSTDSEEEEDVKPSSKSHPTMEEYSQDDEVDRDDFEEDGEWSAEYYESELEDDDDDEEEVDEFYPGGGPVLYQEQADVPDPPVRPAYATRRNFHANRHLILGDFISAIMRVGSGGDHSDEERVFMMVQSDDDNDDNDDDDDV